MRETCGLFLTIIKIFLEAFNSTSKYLDGLLNIDNFDFEQMASQLYFTELQLNKAKFYDTKALLFGLIDDIWHSFI